MRHEYRGQSRAVTGPLPVGPQPLGGRKTWSRSLVLLGLGLTLAWIGLLAYALFGLFVRVL